MIINKSQNSLYKARRSHLKQTQDLTQDKLSTKLYSTPLKREADNVSFKGVSINGIKRSLAFFNEKSFNLNENLALLKKHVGRAPEVLSNYTDNWDEMAEFVQKSQDGKNIVFKEKNWTKLLIDACLYPITDLPFHIAGSLKKSFSKGDKIKEVAETSGFFKNKINTLNNDDIVNSFIGYMETAQKYKHDTEKVQSSGLLSNALKMFNPKTGNYNAVHERALTRIVTGFIPAFFLANDAYNLSRICDDNHETAIKEKKLRFNQETKRVLSNAYIQLITLGALSKWINKSKATFVGVTALTVLLTESFSRLSNGKKIHMISKEEAIEMNKKEGLLPADYKPENKKTQQKPNFKGSQVFQGFQGFGIVSNMPIIQPNKTTDTNKSLDPKLKELNESKPLLSFSTITKWFVGTIALGFALKKAHGIKIKPNVKIKDYINVISKKYDAVFNSITSREYKISKKEFTKIVDKLKEYDNVLGQKFEEVINSHQTYNKVKSMAKELSNTLKENGLDDLAKEFEHLANSGLNKNFKDIPAYNEAQNFIKTRNKSVITQNLNELFDLMKSKNLENEANQIKNIIFDKNGIVDTNKYNDTKKLINKIAKDFSFTFDNRFKVDNEAEAIKMFNNAIKKLKSKNNEIAQSFQNRANEALTSETISLGKTNIPVVKELADFVTEPFKFIWGTITLPYKHIAKPFSKLIKPETKLPEWPKETEVVATTIKRLTRKPLVKLPPMFGEHQGIAKIDYNKKDFAEFMDKQINKAFNTATMSSLSNSDLSALAKNTSTAATVWFLMTDNHNMVMQKSNGENKVQATTKAKERIVQETSRTFYNVMFINLFNNTFRNLYNSSLFGAQTVNTASTLVGEFINRKAIGMPVTPQSRDEILDKEYENITSDGIKGKFFRFMSRLTGKKVLSQREQTKKSKA